MEFQKNFRELLSRDRATRVLEVTKQATSPNRKLQMPLRHAYTALLLFVSIASGSHHLQANDQTVVPGVQPRRLGIHATFIRLSEPSRPLARTLVRPDDRVTDLKYGERVDRVEQGSPAYRA